MKKTVPPKRLAVTTETLRRLDADTLVRPRGAMKFELTEGCPPLPTDDCESFSAAEMVPCCCF